MPEPAFSVDRYGGTYSWTTEPVPWWHWRALLSTLRHPRAAWRARREPRADFPVYLNMKLVDYATAELERLRRETRSIFFGPSALYLDSGPPVDPGLMTRDELLRRSEARAPLNRDTVVDSLLALRNTPPEVRPLYLSGMHRSLVDGPAVVTDQDGATREVAFEPFHLNMPDEAAAARRALALDPSVPSFACCGGVKAFGHEPDCTDEMRRAAPGRIES